MECPRCGFRQPKDDFCARCGVEVSKALRSRRIRAVAINLLVIMALVAGGWALLGPKEKPPPTAAISPKARRAAPKGLAPPPSTATPTPPKPLAPKRGKTSATRRSRELQKTSRKPPYVPKSPQATDELSHKLREWVAMEWFQRGQTLSDGSEAELMMYDRALEADPTFAPAYYHKGIILWQWGQYQQARDSFLSFLKHASPGQRELYPLPEEFQEEIPP